MSMSSPFGTGMSAYDAPLDARLAFIRRTYLHLALAIALFIALSAALYAAGIGFAILRLLAAMPFAWLAVLGGFSLLGWIANEMANPDKSLGAQYGGLALAVVAQALVFSPLFAYAAHVAPEVLPQAAILTGIAFAGLTGYTLTTRKDFSFLRAGLCVASMLALGLIVVSVLFGFGLGTWFSVAMIVLASGIVLYTTSNVLHRYGTDQYVGAAIQLFSAVALLFWYVINLLLSLRR